LLLAQRQLLVDVRLQCVVGNLNLVLALLVLLMILPHVLVHSFIKQVALFFLDFVQLGLQCFDCLLQALLVLFKFLASLFSFLVLLLRALDQHVDVLHNLVFGGRRLNIESLLVRNQALLGDLLLKLLDLSLKFCVQPLDLN